MANEFRKVRDKNGVDHPVTDDKRVDWDSYAKTGVHNFLPNFAETKSNGGLNYTVNSDKSITVGAGTATTESWGYLNVGGYFLEAGTYILTGCPSGGSLSTYELRLSLADIKGGGQSQLVEDTGSGATFTITSRKWFRLYCGIRVENGTTLSSALTFYPMIRLASDTNTAYTPFAETNEQLTKSKVSYDFNAKTGVHQLLPIDIEEMKRLNASGTWNNNVYTRNGVVFTINADKSIDVDASNNTATSTFAIYIKGYAKNSGGAPYVRHKVVLTGCPSGGSENSIYLRFTYYDDSDTANDYGNGVTFTPTASITNDQYVQVLINKVYTGTAHFKPLIRYEEDTNTDFTPYAMTNQELTDICTVHNLTGADDLDNIFVYGTYSWKSPAPLHTPESKTYSYMIVLKADDNTKTVQIVYSVGGSFYLRHYGGSPATWGSWYKYEGTVVS